MRVLVLPAADSTRLNRLAAFGVQLLSAMLALVELGRLALTVAPAEVLAGALAVAVVLPLHAQHLRFGLRGLRPPRAGLTLGVMAAVHVAALALVGQEWAFMLAMLATSALVVLPRPWSLVLLAACCAAPLALAPWQPQSQFGNPAYLAYAILFRSVIQFALVWLVAAAHQLAVARAALADEVVAQERARVEAQVREAVEQRLALVVRAARAAQRGLDGPDVAPPLVALDRVLALSADALSDLRRIVRGDRDRARPGEAAGCALADAAVAGGSPVGQELTGPRARRFAVLAHAVVLPFPLLAVLGVFGHPPGSALPAVVLFVLLVALEVRLALATSRAEPPPGARTRWLAAAAVAAGGSFLLVGPVWSSSLWFSAAIGLMAFGGRGRTATLAVVGVLSVVSVVVDPMPAAGLLGTVAANVWAGAYLATLTLLAVGGLHGSARLVAQVDELETTRAALARRAVDAERRRLSGDLHDVLGQSLTALSLKADLARRFVRRDRALAAAEIDGLLRLATDQAAEVDAVTRGERHVELAVEVRHAVGLLTSAGVDVTCHVDAGDLDDATSTLLGWVVREGATNVLRHARARRCTLRVDRGDGAVVLELTNDGAGEAPSAGGTGLRGLADRLSGAGGDLRAERLPGGRFRLRTELPTLVSA